MHDPYQYEPIAHIRADVVGQLYDSNEIVAVPPKRVRKRKKKEDE
jgi:hypothetical protein